MNRPEGPAAAGDGGPLIRCRDITKDYALGAEVIHALRGVSFDIRDGEFVAIVGRSGSGKSTLMHLLGALDVPTSGELHVAGRNVAELESDALARMRNREIGFVFQQFNLLGRASALSNVQLPLLYAEIPRADKAARARACLDMVGLGDRLDHKPNQLSGGQQQRVALARALINEPRIILADEPTGALDTRTGQDIMVLLRDLNRRGITIILVTHEDDIAAHADRRLQFQDGRLIADEMTGSHHVPAPGQGSAAPELGARP